MKVSIRTFSWAVFMCAMVAGANAAEQRSFVSGNFSLELDGVNVGSVHSVAGGDVAAEVVKINLGTIEKKHIGNVKYEEVSARLGFGMAKPMYDWISDTFDANQTRKSGAIVAADFNSNARERGTFQNAVITEVTIPACDGASKEAGYLAVKFSPEVLKWESANATKLSPASTRQKQWVTSNFRLDIPGLECTRVQKIDSFTVKQTVVEFIPGESRDRLLEPGKIEFPNVRVTVPAAFASTWLKWADDFLLKGNSGEKNEKQGTLTLLSPDLREELARVSFINVGIVRVHRSLSESSNSVSTVTVDLYVDRMEIDFMAQFDK